MHAKLGFNAKSAPFRVKKLPFFVKRKSLEHTLFFHNRRSDNGKDVDTLLAKTKSELEETLRHQARGCCI